MTYGNILSHYSYYETAQHKGCFVSDRFTDKLWHSKQKKLFMWKNILKISNIQRIQRYQISSVGWLLISSWGRQFYVECSDTKSEYRWWKYTEMIGVISAITLSWSISQRKFATYSVFSGTVPYFDQLSCIKYFCP